MYRIGIDVGGTNTDAAILDEELRPLATTKAPTTRPVDAGIGRAISEVLASSKIDPAEIGYAMLGTTQATNAVVERKHLNSVVVIRIGLPATAAIPPLTGWPEDLREAIGQQRYLVRGGTEYDGREITALDEHRIRQIAREVAGRVTSAAITSVFSPVSAEHEERAAAIVRDELGTGFPVSLSNEIGSIGLLERENATVLNAALVDVARATVDGFVASLASQGIHAKVYLGQNDGTLMSVEYAQRYPILTIACGPTNSIRGASFLAREHDAIVVDVGGTTTDVGVLVKGFPRESSLAAEIGGVRTNFRMPDLVSIGLGGGSIVRRRADGSVSIGPDSVGYEITEKALVFGGDVLTATDIAVASGHADLGDASRVKDLGRDLVSGAWKEIQRLAADAIDKVKTSAADRPVMAVGGGSIIIPDDIPGASVVIKPEHFEVANAIGAAIAQVSGQVERIFTLDEMTRAEAMDIAKKQATDAAIDAGAEPASVEIVDLEDVPLAYLPGNATRVRAKAAGRLQLTPTAPEVVRDRSNPDR
ncbi:hydantoinase/oxoprolinase family protein [Propionimicrobium sp. PCR01-08-3]|uniref:hydantoinase/oxoprolinase family protein n=1 Tax=Propionimicrobium sp. PCR01-08-3 TaxID=3052086 RepID=UPI00255CF918|nr:hydantoinase/oxoprolinase family protein [Propionimicrobium sp. PCR01-08-3]WIY83211.1 hydantoinase/oxoprolinase family protein [Propionimicrobium sp. PCR01-08-3]